MNIVCPSCSAVYAFDVARIPTAGKKVQCSQCNFVFVVRPPDEGMDHPEDESTEVMSSKAVSRSLTGAERMGELLDGEARESSASRRLILRQDGTRYSVKDMETLQRWIVERRITREAELSEDGETFERVGSRPDLANFFEMVERSHTGGPTTSHVGSASTRVSGRVEGVRVITSLRPRGAVLEDDEEDEDEDDDEDEDEDLYFEDNEELFEDDDDEAVARPSLTGVDAKTPVFTKSQLLGDAPRADGAKAAVAASASGSPAKAAATQAPVSTSTSGAPAATAAASAAAASTAAATRAPETQGAAADTAPAPTAQAPVSPAPPAAQPEEERSSSAGIWLAAALIIIVGGLAWYLKGTGDSTPTVVASGPDKPMTSDPVRPVGPPLGPDGKPIPVAKPPPTPAPPTPKPVATPEPPRPTPAPTPAPPAPTPSPKPVKVATKTKVSRPPAAVPKPPAEPELSPREKADKVYEEGKALKKAGDLPGAIAAFKKANQMQPTPLYYEELGYAYLSMYDRSRKSSDLQDAEASFRNAVARDGRRAASYLGLGWVYRQQNRLEDALRAVDACLLRNPDTDTRLEAEGLKKSLQERMAMGG